MTIDEPRLPVRLGPFDVETDRESVRDLAVAITPEGQVIRSSETVPHTFPVRWLTAKAIRDTVVAWCGSSLLLVQSFQVLTYRQPLAIAASYKLTLEISNARRSGADLWLNALVYDTEGSLVLEMQTGLMQVTALPTVAAR